MLSGASRPGVMCGSPAGRSPRMARADQVERALELGDRVVQGIRDSLRDAGRRRDPQTSRPDPAEPHAISAGEEGEIEEVASKPPAERRSWQVADVSRQGAEIPGVI